MYQHRLPELNEIPLEAPEETLSSATPSELLSPTLSLPQLPSPPARRIHRRASDVLLRPAATAPSMLSSFTVTAHRQEVPAEEMASSTASTTSSPPAVLPQLKEQKQRQRPGTAAPAPEVEEVLLPKDSRQSLKGGGRLLKARTASRSVWDWTRGGVKVV